MLRCVWQRTRRHYVAATSACVAVYVLKEVHAYVLAESQPDRPTPSPAQCTNTEAGLGQLRYLCERCIAMSKHATVTRLRRHMYKRMDLYREDKSKLHLLCKLLRSKKARSYIAQYSVLRTAQSALHFTSLTDLFTQKPSRFLLEASSHMLQLMREGCSYTYPPLSIARPAQGFTTAARIRTRVLVVESSKLYP